MMIADRPRSHGGVRRLAQWIKPLILRLAGTRLMPLYGVIVHRGRRSGKTFHTPVVVRPTSDGLVVPMPWGEATDWFRNVQAAGVCVIRWKGRDYAMVQPEVVDTTAFSAPLRGVTSRLGIRQALRLRYAG